ncbi:MAG TPA: DHH family phosphoesterase [Elusimicrobiota bacterium]|nr:DHH family phosphoesterase [Elusimicrobiota bacterium]
MSESVLVANAAKCSESHKAQWESLRSQNPGIDKILAAAGKPQGLALVFSHDDPDGITSGLIFKRLLEKKGWRTVWKMPAGFVLTTAQFDAALKAHPDAKAVFVLDKGTLAPYADFGKRMPVYLVDHHPSPKAPTDCVLFNPCLEKYASCSGSFLAHGLATLAGTRDDYDDFLALIGLKGDWAIEPTKGILSDMVKPFFAEYAMKFRNLLQLVTERPTMFDAEQRELTCPLSRFAEFVHAVGGGGFQYFYNDRDASLRDVDHPACIGAALEKMAGKVAELKKITTLDDFIKLLPEPEAGSLKKIWKFFLEDWEKAFRLLDSSTKILGLADTSLYVFVGGKVPLLPMIGSIKLFELKQAAKDKFAQIIMVSSVSADYTHVSVRGTGDQVHSGKFCGQLAGALQTKFPKQKDVISGGGHPRAAECTVRTGEVPFIKVLHEVVLQLNEMSELDNRSRAAAEGSHQARAKELGLDYLSLAKA